MARPAMTVVILGCGTSTGVPVIGCRCPVCSSDEPKNRRTRSSLLVTAAGLNILIDTSTDLRSQALANNVAKIDAVLFTHSHADHIHGIDDLRAFNLIKKGPIPCYSSPETIGKIRKYFHYIFSESGAWKPRIEANAVERSFFISTVEVTPVPVLHGKDEILGYRIGNMGYLTDCSAIPASSLGRLRELSLLILGALRQTPHPSHFSISQAIEAARSVGAKKTILTHLSHNIDYTREGADLPEDISLAYDGMRMEFPPEFPHP